MSLLIDSRICPDCRAVLDGPTCTGCGLVLTGPLAQELWTTMVTADALIERLRAATPQVLEAPGTAPEAPVAAPEAPVASPVASPVAAASGTSLTAGLPAAPPAPPRRPLAPPVSSSSVQNVLLVVGGLCLLVAATVFIVVSWSSLGLAGRTLVLTGITVLAATAAVAVSRRALRGSAETLWAVTGTLVLIDLLAAWGAGFFDALADRQVVGLVGVVLLTGALVVGAWASTSPVPRLVVPVLFTLAGTVALAASEAWTAPHAAAACSLAIPVLAVAGLLLTRWHDRVLAPHGLVVAGLAVATWCVLVLHGLERAVDVTAAHWWHEFSGWPLLVAAGWAAVAATLRLVPAELRYVAAALSLACLVALAAAGSASPEQKTVVLCLVALALAAVSAAAPWTWSRPAGAMATVGVLAALLVTVLRPVAVITGLPTTARPDHADLGLRVVPSDWDLAPWTAVLLAVVAALTALGLLRHVPVARRQVTSRLWRTLAPVIAALGGVTVLLENRPALVLAVLAWTGLVALAAGLALVHRAEPVALTAGLSVLALLMVAALRLAVASHVLVAVLATVLAVLVTLAAGRARTERLAGTLVPALSAAAVLLTGFAAMHWPYVAGGRGDAAGVSLAVVAAVVGIGSSRLGRTEASRLAVEASALGLAAVAPFLVTSEELSAVTVTIAGSAVALVSITERDRDRLSWLATALLAVGTVLRVDAGTSAPEALALPAAALLLAAGTWRLRHDAEVTSWRALGSGLSLGLVPSLLLTLHDPVSLRGVLVAVAGLAALALGIAGRWAAPFLAGAAVVAVLAVRHLGPVAAALPRWISLGSVGLVLLLVGITWEARRRDAAAAERYLAALR